MAEIQTPGLLHVADLVVRIAAPIEMAGSYRVKTAEI